MQPDAVQGHNDGRIRLTRQLGAVCGRERKGGLTDNAQTARQRIRPAHSLRPGPTGETFSWGAAGLELAGLPGGGLNIAYEAVDRHANGPRRNHLALRCLDRTEQVREYTYGALQALTNRFANVLRSLEVNKGDRVFTALGQVPELYLTALGTLKNGSVFCPLFSGFGPIRFARGSRRGRPRS